jgi:antitoxin (DNA-binding transcriptional repressor) of toxin-antitoxin stability system
MKTLTITEARKNLGRWLGAAVRGEDIGIISGADIIALRKVEVEAVEEYSYAMREYGVTRKELDRFGKAVDQHIARERREGKKGRRQKAEGKKHRPAAPGRKADQNDYRRTEEPN